MSFPRKLFLVAVTGFFILMPLLVSDSAVAQQPDPITLNKSGPNAPDVKVYRDDHVATMEMDYVAGNPWTPFDIGEDGLGPVGYRVSWIPLRRTRSINPFQRKVTSLRRVQIQPLHNDEPYFVRVDCVNRLGELVGDRAYGRVNGGSDARVELLRREMTGFFDDFNRPAGLPDETKWNTTYSRVNDPDLQAFFINSQFHSHTLVGTPASGFGDRGQTVHRIRNPLTMVAGETRKIVFDLDGGNVAGRAIWYLDLLKDETEITSHFTLGGGSGSYGHPSGGLRFSLIGQRAAVWTLNQAGEQLLIEESASLGFGGAQTFPNVRRQFEILLSENHVTMSMDGVTVLDSDLGIASVDPGEYTVHWTAFGYNTMKVNMPYFLLHWDNFGFDGPRPANVVHNYRSKVAGTDYVQSNNYSPKIVWVDIPDSLSPRNGAVGEARLVFTRQMEDFDVADWTAQDLAVVNGIEYSIPEPVSNATPPLQFYQLINSNAAYSTSIPLGTVGQNGTASLVQGLNAVTFEAAQCGFHNVHIEIKYPRGSQPLDFTPPEEMYPVPLHHDFPKVGLPARITRIGSHEISPYVEDLNEQTVFNPTISGTVAIGALVNGDEFVNDQTLTSDFVSTQLAASGENPGIKRVRLWIRPNGGGANSAVMLASVRTDANVGAPQFIESFDFDTTQFANGVYELTLVAEDTLGVPSMPDFAGAGKKAGSPAALNGYYFPLHVTINN